jgi:D-alanyl-lipoteichoic acid acyltransferase DltB (MBOAT superfamily)
MPLTNPTFLVFLAVTLAAYWALAGSRVGRTLVLTAAGYVFYAWFNPYCLALLIGISLSDHAIARRIAARRAAGRSSRAWVALPVVLDLSLLAAFKYAGFAMENLGELAAALGSTWTPPAFAPPLPIGISFYVFQSLAYVIEVHRGKTAPAESVLDYLAHMAFFPRLVAGPIVRAGEFLPQLAARPSMDREKFGLALFLIATGLVKKLLIADALALNLVDRVFDFPRMYSATEVLLAAYAFTLQIYCDFAGYTDLALGTALLFGVRLPGNFDFPYQSASVREFWRRWHITLSTWLRDFLYVSLGGARVAPGRIYVNLMITMLLGGLWHGAGWTFVLWGGLHGLALCATRLRQRVRERRGGRPIGWLAPVKVVLTFHFVALAWVFFRADSFAALTDLKDALVYGITARVLNTDNVDPRTWMLLAAGVAGMWFPRAVYLKARDAYTRLPLWAQLPLAALAGYAIWRLAAGGMTQFVYEKF